MKNYKEKYEEQLDMNGGLSDKIERLEDRVDFLIERKDLIDKKIEEAIKELHDFCEECPSHECCPEEECVGYRIEKILIGE